MPCFRLALVALLASATLTAGSRLAADDAKPKGNCIIDAFASKLGITPEQKTEIQKVYADSEQKTAPVCERIWKLHGEHNQAVLQILTPDQKADLPAVMKAERAKMLKHFATKLELTEDQKKQVMKICDESAVKFEQLADVVEGKRSEKFQALKKEQFEAFCQILSDDQRVKLPALIQEEMQSGRTPSTKSELRHAIAEKLKLTEDQKTRLDKVCDDFATKIDEQKTQMRAVCKEKQAATEKILTEEQKVKFLQYMKATGDQ